MTIPGIAAPRFHFDDTVEPIAVALAQERQVSDQINALTATARSVSDYGSEQCVQWFIREQTGVRHRGLGRSR